MVPHQLPSASEPAAPKVCQPWGPLLISGAGYLGYGVDDVDVDGNGPLLIGGAGYLGDRGDGDNSEGRLLCRDDDGGGGGFGSVDDVTYFALILCIWFIISGILLFLSLISNTNFDFCQSKFLVLWIQGPHK